MNKGNNVTLENVEKHYEAVIDGLYDQIKDMRSDLEWAMGFIICELNCKLHPDESIAEDRYNEIINKYALEEFKK